MDVQTAYLQGSGLIHACMWTQQSRTANGSDCQETNRYPRDLKDDEWEPLSR
jgi:hypothetical protein